MMLGLIACMTCDDELTVYDKRKNDVTFTIQYSRL